MASGQTLRGGIKNGALLKLIEREGFEVFLTGDKNMENQQQLEGRPFAVLVMSAINWPVVSPAIHIISAAIDEAQPGRVRTIDCGVFIARRGQRKNGLTIQVGACCTQRIAIL